MVQSDPEQERLRLTELYSHQTDEELEQLAGQAAELTDIARETLKAELAKRGITLSQVQKTTGDEQPEYRELITVRTCWGLLEAQLAKGLLDAAGIESFLFDDNMVRQNAFYANALGGVKLQVDAQNADEANRILEENAQDAAADIQDSPP